MFVFWLSALNTLSQRCVLYLIFRIKLYTSSIHGIFFRSTSHKGLSTLSQTITFLFCYNHMYRTLTDPKLLRRLPHSRVILYNIISNLHGSFLNVIFQKNPPANILFTMYAEEKVLILHLFRKYLKSYYMIFFPYPSQLSFPIPVLPHLPPGSPLPHSSDSP